MQRVMVVDRNELSRAGFVALLAAEPDIEVHATGERPPDTARDLARTRPDLVLVAEENGIGERLEHVMADCAGTPVVAFAGGWDPATATLALQLGVRGLAVKSGSRAAILAAVHAVASGGMYFAPCVAETIVAATLEREESGAGPAPELLHRFSALTLQEHRVLRLLAQGMTTEDIADSLAVSSGTVKSHVSHLLHKLHLRDRVQAVVLAYRSGFVGSAAGSR
ncbi:response regulator transcription factor [Streptomyces sp. TRM70308]|uniref:LuxR C-terminal-related transcriptional regulator n=1 Tax=Streptomyces TaxID=1883 RepID=UPI002248BE9E|nr:response regulator transcription factor [Streptomyces sp. JHD 1]MCX2970965.1 response regulator transcription factor [Streptomyces sp. JHD 1]